MTWLLLTNRRKAQRASRKGAGTAIIPAHGRSAYKNSFPRALVLHSGSSRVEKKNAVQRSRTAEEAKKAGLKPAPKECIAMQLVRGGLGLFSRQDADEAAVTALS